MGGEYGPPLTAMLPARNASHNAACITACITARNAARNAAYNAAHKHHPQHPYTRLYELFGAFMDGVIGNYRLYSGFTQI